MTNSRSGDSGRISFTPAQLDEIADRLVSDEVPHSMLNRKFSELGIVELSPSPSPQETRLKNDGLHAGVGYYTFGPSKRRRLLHAVNVMYRRSGGHGVMRLISTLHDPVFYDGRLYEFREFCDSINRILRYVGLEYRDDGQFHRVVKTRTLAEAERRAREVFNRLESRRTHFEVTKYCKAEYMEENYFHAAFEATKGLAERIREKTGLEADGVNLARQAFSRRKNGLPRLAFNTLQTETERNEHDGFTNLLIGSFQMFRNPIAHTPKIKWQRDIEDAVDCLRLISFLHHVLDECYQTPANQQE